VSYAKTAEPIVRPFVELTHVGAMNSALDGVEIERVHSPPPLVRGDKPAIAMRHLAKSLGHKQRPQ